MSYKDSLQDAALPLAGCRVIERSRTVAAAYAGRLLASMGATAGDAQAHRIGNRPN